MLRRRRDRARRILMLQRVEGRAHHVVGVRRAERLRHHVLHAERLEHRAHRAAGDDAGAGRRRAQEHLAGAVAAVHVVMQRAAFAQRHADDIALGGSVALRIASGTSRALPWPKPTRPFWSPTITSAAKPKRRPPLTTLATRLMWTSLSMNSLGSRSPLATATAALSSRFMCHNDLLSVGQCRPSSSVRNFRPPSRAASASALMRPW